MLIRNFADVQALEAEPVDRRALPRSTYDALAASAKRWPEAKALSFFWRCGSNRTQAIGSGYFLR
jgi:fatty-acyl-CoA synthase